MRYCRSRWFEVIEIGTDREPICDVLSVFHCNYTPICYHFRDKTIYSKISIFLPILPTPVSLEAVARGFPCDLWKSLGYVPDADIGKWNPCDPVRICLRRIIGYRLVTKGQTDRRTDGQTYREVASRSGIAERDQKSWIGNGSLQHLIRRFLLQSPILSKISSNSSTTFWAIHPAYRQTDSRAQKTHSTERAFKRRRMTKLDLWPSDSKSWPFHPLRGPLVPVHRSRFILFQIRLILFTSLVVEERTDGKKHYARSAAASLNWRRHNKLRQISNTLVKVITVCD